MPTITVRRFRDIGAVIRAVRRARGITQDELADSLAFSRDYLRTLEQGRSKLTTVRLFRVLDRLGVTVTLEYSLGDDGDGEPT
ncbi:MAG: helix-turn-helix domain-containing protein [Propionibacteriaceae bacterium]|jgi:transcriptional regulator with XRE-family HTH domain|nr:helix-turn-helix domain-containing protein [Propionibacteriaceae bacterium]